MTELQRNLIINIAGAIVITLATHYALKPLKESKMLKTKTEN